MIPFLLGFICGAFVWSKMFPDTVIKNDVEQNIKKVKDSPGTNVDMEYTDTKTEPKTGGFLGFLKRKKK